MADFTQAIKLNLDHTSTYYNRGIARRTLQDYSGAISNRSALRCADFTEVIRAC